MFYDFFENEPQPLKEALSAEEYAALMASSPRNRWGIENADDPARAVVVCEGGDKLDPRTNGGAVQRMTHDERRRVAVRFLDGWELPAAIGSVYGERSRHALTDYTR